MKCITKKIFVNTISTGTSQPGQETLPQLAIWVPQLAIWVRFGNNKYDSKKYLSSFTEEPWYMFKR